MENTYTKMSDSGYIVGDSINSDHMGNISLWGDEIRFYGIEFDYRFIFDWNQLICSKDGDYNREHSDIM